jgi:hypothetical protein
MLRHYEGVAQIVTKDGTEVGTGQAHLVEGSDDGVVPQWQGRALVGRPAWKGLVVATGVDWLPWVDRREPLILRTHLGEGPFVPAYASSATPGELQVEGGPPVPF